MAMTKGDRMQVSVVSVSREVIEKIKIKFQWIINVEFEIRKESILFLLLFSH